MTAITETNTETLQRMLLELQDATVYTCIEVYSKGNKIYLLKDFNEWLFVLIVPQAPLNDLQRDGILSYGFTEIWQNINYVKEITYTDLSELTNLTNTIESVFTSVFAIEKNRNWRFEKNTGMQVIKDTKTPILTRVELLKRNKKKQHVSDLIFNNFVYSILLTVYIVGFVFDNQSSASQSVYLFITTLPVSYVAVYCIRFLIKFDFRKLVKWIFLSKRYSDYFQQFGFEKFGDRYKGEINGYFVDFVYSEYYTYIIVVYHKKISYEKAIEMPLGNFFGFNYSYIGLYYSEKRMYRGVSRKKLLKEANKFVDMLISNGFERN